MDGETETTRAGMDMLKMGVRQDPEMRCRNSRLMKHRIAYRYSHGVGEVCGSATERGEAKTHSMIFATRAVASLMTYTDETFLQRC